MMSLPAGDVSRSSSLSPCRDVSRAVVADDSPSFGGAAVDGDWLTAVDWRRDDLEPCECCRSG
jgi:hypothetical protein